LFGSYLRVRELQELEREGEIIDWRNEFANRLEALCILEYIKKTGLVWTDGFGALRVSQTPIFHGSGTAPRLSLSLRYLRKRVVHLSCDPILDQVGSPPAHRNKIPGPHCYCFVKGEPLFIAFKS
jgi:hypothetical protein